MVKINKKMKQKQGGGEGGNKQAMQFNHALGQHILKNPLIVQALVDKVRLRNSFCDFRKSISNFHRKLFHF